MNDRPLDARLQAYFAPLATVDAPASLRASVAAIPDEAPLARGWRDLLRSRRVLVLATLLLIAAAVGTALFIGSHLRQSTPFRPPAFFDSGLIAFDSDGDIYVANPDGSSRRQLTSGPAVDAFPTWSPDGTRVAFWSQATGLPVGDKTAPRSLVVMAADGSGRRTLADGIVYEYAISWSPDSQRIAYHFAELDAAIRLELVSIDGSTPVHLADGVGDFFWSPDGLTIAYESGRRLHLVSADGSGIRTLGGIDSEPSWSPDGRAIAYAAGGALHLASPDGTGDRVLVGSGVGAIRGWSPDGTRIAYGSSGCCGPITDTWIVRRDGNDAHVITHATGTEGFGGWSPDGTSTLISLGDAGGLTVVIADADGLNGRSLAVGGLADLRGWSPDGTRLLGVDAGGLLLIDPAGKAATIRIPFANANGSGAVSWQGLPSVERVALGTFEPVSTTPVTSSPPASPVSTASPTRRSTSGFDVPFSFEAPTLVDTHGGGDAWQQSAVSPHAYAIEYINFGAEFGVAAFSAARLYADPCHPSKGFAETGSTPGDLAAALGVLPGFVVSPVETITLDGYSGVAVDFHPTATDASGCDPIPLPGTGPDAAASGYFALLQADPGVDEVYVISAQSGGYGPGALATRHRVSAVHWVILDVHGTRVILEAWANDTSGDPAQIVLEVEKVLDSVRFQ